MTTDAPKPMAAVMTPARILRKRFSSGDSRNFSNGGRISSATFSRSFAELICRILSATAIPMCSRADTADCVIASGFSSELRTMRKSVPQARQNWLSCRSSEPQDGQYMTGDYTAKEGWEVPDCHKEAEKALKSAVRFPTPHAKIR